MIIGIIGDIHFCEYSSILRSRGEKFSTRLENCIESINWAEKQTDNCDLVVYLGDFFDKSSLNAEEITALNDIKWNNIPHRFLVGNHEMGINSLIFSSAHIFKELSHFKVIDECYTENIGGVELCYIPYILEENRLSISEYFTNKNDKRIIFSHNDISGISMGKFISKAGFSIDDIESNCSMYFNGHLHNGSKITDKIINVGNLTGQNFSEDAFKYTHKIYRYDTDCCHNYMTIENPYAINFYKIDDITKLNDIHNAVLTIKTSKNNVEEIKELIKDNNNIIASRLIVDCKNDNINSTVEKLSINHLDEFKKFVYMKLENTVDNNLLNEEVSYIYG